MKRIWQLNKRDIQEILAQYFDVVPDSVYIECFEDYIGYGRGECKELNVRAEVVQNEERNIKE